MLRGYKPDWLYELLPHIYLGGGVLTVVLLRNPIASISGLLLMSAAVVVWQKRRRFRRRMAAAVSRHQTEAAGRRAQDGLTQLVWRNRFEVGHSVIDHHHRELFVRCNELIEDIRAEKAQGDIELRLYELFWAFEAHCEAERKLLDRSGGRRSDEEVDGHEAMLADAKAMRERYHQGELAIGDLVRFVAYDVLVEHVTGGGANPHPA